MKRAYAGSCILEWTPSHSSAKRASAIEEPTLICGENHKCLKIAAKPRFEGSRRLQNSSLRRPVSTFAYIYGEGRKLARNAGVFLPQRTGESHLTPNSPDPASILSVRNKNGSLQRPGMRSGERPMSDRQS